ncbi:MAG: hypothetical protein FWG98_12860 [Candidatus Cloacimonetes bacterium]|nr:hypothetical protein [Candidatus Cloacimonadota bacterium]
MRRYKLQDMSYKLQDLGKMLWISLLIFFLVSFAGNLHSQHLRLPDEEIFGVLTVTPDSLEVTKDYTEYYRVSNPNRLNYRAVLERMVDLDTERRPFGYLYTQGYGTFSDDLSYLGAIHLGIQDPNTPLINFYGMFSKEEVVGRLDEEDPPFPPNDKHDVDFGAQKMMFDWRPTFANSRMVINPSLSFQQSDYVSKYFAIHESTMMSLGASLAINSIERRFLNQLKISADYLTHTQPFWETPQGYKDKTQNYLELGFNLNLPRLSILTETDINVYNYYKEMDSFSDDFGKNFHIEGNFYFPIPFLNIFALNLQYSDWLLPSLLFEKSIYLNEISEISVSNFPYMQLPSMNEYHEYFPFAEFPDRLHAQQVPLNAFLKFSLFNPVEIQFYFNSKLMKNYHYIFIDNTPVSLPYQPINGHIWMNDDFLVNSINLELHKKVNNFTIRAFLKGQIVDISTEKRLPWEPNIESSLSLSYQYKRYTVGVSGTALFERYGFERYGFEDDSNPDKIYVWQDNVFLLSNTHDFDIHRNFKLSLNLNNILDENYEKITGLPSAGFNAELIMKVLF